MLGIASRKVWVMAKLMIKTARTIGEVKARRKGAEEINNTETKFTCIPGTRPVMIPKKIPRDKAMKISKIILSQLRNAFYLLW